MDAGSRTENSFILVGEWGGIMMRGDGGRGRLCWHCSVTVHGFTVRLVAWRICVGSLDRGKVAYARKHLTLRKTCMHQQPTSECRTLFRPLLPLPRTHQGNDRQRRTSSPSRPRPGETRISSTRNGVKINVDRIARYFASSVTVSGGSPNAASADCVRWLGQQKAIPMWPCGSHLVDAMRIIWRVMGHLVWRTPQ